MAIPMAKAVKLNRALQEATPPSVCLSAPSYATNCFPAVSSLFASPAGKHKSGTVWGYKSFNLLTKTGAGEEIRTLDPNLGKVVLYH